mgnify:CR=1 FL=1
MKLQGPLRSAKLIKRYKRFLADIELADGSCMTIHCPNTGSMKNCQNPGNRVWYSLSDNPKRKYPGTWQVIEMNDKDLVGINTGLANALVAEAIVGGRIPQLSPEGELRREVPYGTDNKSRIDLLLTPAASGASCCYIEIKNVSLGEADGVGLFPDAVTQRGQKHLRELMQVKQQGDRAMLFFCVQHSGIESVSPADTIDPEYGRLLREAHSAGVEIIAYRASFDLDNSAIELTTELPVLL